MLPGREDLVTKSDLSSELSLLRGEIREIRSEMALKFATKDDLLEMGRDFEVSIQKLVRTFIVVQAATVLGMSGILLGLLQLS